MSKFRMPLIAIVILLLTYQVHSAPAPLSRWVMLRSDAREEVRTLIRSEVNKREGFSTPEEERASLNAVENEKESGDSAYKRAIAAANKEFTQAKKRRDDLTSQFQAVSIELEEQQKNIKTIRAGSENLDNQISRYSQDIKTQQEALKKWLQTEKQGEALTAVIFTRGFKDSAHTLESISDQASAPLMAQHMGAYIQSFTTVINSVLTVDFIRAVEEGTAKWNNEEPLRIELEKGSRGTSYLRLKRYELFPFQTPKGGRVRPAAAPKNIHAAVITSGKELDDLLAKNGYSSAHYDLARAYGMIKETEQMNTAAGEGLHEQIRSFQDRIGSLQEKIVSARAEKEVQSSILRAKEEPYRKATQDRDIIQSRKEEADRVFQASQRALHDIRRVRESIIVKTALATARGSQSPADASAEAIIDKLEEVKNDAKTQHSSSTTEVTNFQVTAESSYQAITEARITAAQLIAFINEGDSVRVKMAFRIRTVLDEPGEEGARREMPPPARKVPAAPQPPPKAPAESTLSRFVPSFLKSTVKEDSNTEKTPEPDNAAAARTPVMRNPGALGSAEATDVLFEIISAKSSGDEISVFVDLTNTAADAARNVAIYDEAYSWAKSKLTDTAGKEYEVSQVFFWKGQQKSSVSDTGRRGVSIEAGAKQTVQLIFNLKTINQLTIRPFIYVRTAFIWTWQEGNLVFQNIRLGR
jgi:hypothetical protein